MHKCFRVTVLLAVFLVCCLGLVLGQTTATGNISGTVLDYSKAVVVGANVVVTNKATAASRSTVTNATGDYRFDQMPAGTYTVAISKQGFSKVIQTVDLLVGNTTAVNAALKPGGSTEVVEVSGEAPMVDAAKTSV